MPDQKISAMTAATTLADADELVLASSGANKKITGANLKASIPGSLVLLSTTTIAGSAAAFDVASIPQTYNDLILVLVGRASFAANSDSVMLRFNNDTGANYATEQINGSGTGNATLLEQNADNKISPGSVPASSASAGWFGMMEMLVHGYASTTWNKLVTFMSSYATSLTSNKVTTRGTGVWGSTTAINRVQLLINDSPNTFVIGSQLRIYGRL